MATPEAVEADASLVVQIAGGHITVTTDMGNDELIDLLLEIIDRVEAGIFDERAVGRVQ